MQLQSCCTDAAINPCSKFALEPDLQMLSQRSCHANLCHLVAKVHTCSQRYARSHSCCRGVGQSLLQVMPLSQSEKGESTQILLLLQSASLKPKCKEMQMLVCELLRRLSTVEDFIDDPDTFNSVVTGCFRCLQSLHLQNGDNHHVSTCSFSLINEYS